MTKFTFAASAGICGITKDYTVKDVEIAYVDVDKKFQVIIEVLENGDLELRVYPRDKEGELWDNPVDVFRVDADEIEQAHKEIGEAA